VIIFFNLPRPFSIEKCGISLALEKKEGTSEGGLSIGPLMDQIQFKENNK
jgi:hypothetical protein